MVVSILYLSYQPFIRDSDYYDLTNIIIDRYKPSLTIL